MEKEFSAREIGKATVKVKIKKKGLDNENKEIGNNLTN